MNYSSPMSLLPPAPTVSLMAAAVAPLNYSYILMQYPLPKIDKIKTFGNSMTPLLQAGDIIYLSKVPFKKLKIDDIITVKKGNFLFTHRIIYKSKKYLVTKGDSNLEDDGRITANQIVGRVRSVKRDNYIFSLDETYLVQSSLYFQEIVQINKVFKKEEINFLFLKGLPLSLYYFKKHPRRIYADCDILIEDTLSNIKKVDLLLQTLGFTPEDLQDYKKAQLFLTKNYQQKSYFKKISGSTMVVEIHYRIPILTHKISLPESFKINNQEKLLAQEFLQTKRNVTFNQYQFPILQENYFILYLLLHFYSHKWTGAYRLEQIAQILNKRSNRINIKFIISSAKKRKILNFIIPGLYLLKKFYQHSTLFSFTQQNYHSNSNYSLFFYKFMYGEKTFLGEGSFFTAKERLKRGAVTFFLIDQPLYTKLFLLCNITLILHVCYFLILVVHKKIKQTPLLENIFTGENIYFAIPKKSQ